MSIMTTLWRRENDGSCQGARGFLFILVACSLLAVGASLRTTPVPVRCVLDLSKASHTRAVLHAVTAGTALLCSPSPLSAIQPPLSLVPVAQEVLHKPTSEVQLFGDELAELTRDLFAAMYASGGIGLAAPQVGIGQSIAVYNVLGPLRFPPTEHVLINPRVVRTSDLRWTAPEGCLSEPEAHSLVTRPLQIDVESLDLEGAVRQQTFTGVEGRVVLHEIDHLNGVLFTDRGWEAGNLAASSLCYVSVLLASFAVARIAQSTEVH